MTHLLNIMITELNSSHSVIRIRIRIHHNRSARSARLNLPIYASKPSAVHQLILSVLSDSLVEGCGLWWVSGRVEGTSERREGRRYAGAPARSSAPSKAPSREVVKTRFSSVRSHLTLRQSTSHGGEHLLPVLLFRCWATHHSPRARTSRTLT